jgi:hypothetical protein
MDPPPPQTGKENSGKWVGVSVKKGDITFFNTFLWMGTNWMGTSSFLKKVSGRVHVIDLRQNTGI